MPQTRFAIEIVNHGNGAYMFWLIVRVCGHGFVVHKFMEGDR
jgi:hypothetical protein